jgi:hypothetical protein
MSSEVGESPWAEWDRLNAEHKKLLDENAELVKVNQALRKENISLRLSVRQVERETLGQFYGLHDRLTNIRDMLDSIEVPEPFDDSETDDLPE